MSIKYRSLTIIFAIFVINICGENQEIEANQDKSIQNNIQAVFQVLLGKICLCRCGEPSFSTTEYRQASDDNITAFPNTNDTASKVNDTLFTNSRVKITEDLVTQKDDAHDPVENHRKVTGNGGSKNNGTQETIEKNDDDLVVEKLIGGDVLRTNGFPWSALVVIKGVVSAGGAIISDKHVISAASPFLGIAPGEVKVLIGAHDRCLIDTTASNISVSSITLHPSYLITDHRHDISILTLSSKLSFNKYISLACLPTSVYSNYPPVSWISSWLSPTAPNLLFPRPPPNCVPKVIRLPFLTNDECLRASNGLISLSYEKGCLGPFGTRSQICSGDVGSAVQIINKKGRFELFGILIDTNMCDVNQVVVYIRIDQHIHWIKTAISSGCSCKD